MNNYQYLHNVIPHNCSATACH